MARKNVILTTAFIVVVAALYLYEYRDALVSHPIQISHTLRLRMAIARRRPSNPPASLPLIPTFTLGKDYRITSIKLIRVDELKEKGFAHPLWELTTDSKSYPTRVFLYGRGIPGMHPKVAEAEPEPLETNVAYRIEVAAGRLEGHHDFTISAQDVSTPGGE